MYIVMTCSYDCEAVIVLTMPVSSLWISSLLLCSLITDSVYKPAAALNALRVV